VTHSGGETLRPVALLPLLGRLADGKSPPAADEQAPDIEDDVGHGEYDHQNQETAHGDVYAVTEEMDAPARSTARARDLIDRLQRGEVLGVKLDVGGGEVLL
jgi:hypothetical protein